MKDERTLMPWRALNRILVPLTLLGTTACGLLILDAFRREHNASAQEAHLEALRNAVAELAAERAHLAAPARLEPAARKLGLIPRGPRHLSLARQPRSRH